VTTVGNESYQWTLSGEVDSKTKSRVRFVTFTYEALKGMK